MRLPVEYTIEELLRFALQKGLLGEMDVIPARNKLLHMLQLQKPWEGGLGSLSQEVPETATGMLDILLEHCREKGIIGPTLTEADLMDTAIMGELVPRASEVVGKFRQLFAESPRKATDYFYALGRDCNYIRVDRVAKDLYWRTPTGFGELEITVNLSKPEKDPREIVAAKSAPSAGYPKCLLCRENVGYGGNAAHPARQNLRLVPVKLGEEQWYLQYSPYVYYNEHCIVLHEDHIPMRVTSRTFSNMFSFIEQFPHYFIGSNADLPIVGGSILTHDHFQGGRHIFPMEKAGAFARFAHPAYPGIGISLVNWPLSVVRLSTQDPGQGWTGLAELSSTLLDMWRGYTDPEAGILAFTGDTPHNTITPIARRNARGCYEIDLVLRNNRTTPEHPGGLFHPRESLHHIKKENIGLIEVMGLAVLPGRLAGELEQIKNILTGGDDAGAGSIAEGHPLYAHRDWIGRLVQQHGTSLSEAEAGALLRQQVGAIFLEVLKDAGVFKTDAAGREYFSRFPAHAGFRPA